jgi:hypothetical protein
VIRFGEQPRPQGLSRQVIDNFLLGVERSARGGCTARAPRAQALLR